MTTTQYVWLALGYAIANVIYDALNIRRHLKDFLTWIGLGRTMTEYCDDCGVKQPLVWWCEDEKLWNAVVGKGALCPKCFDDRATAKGFFLRWYPKDESERVNS